MLNVNWTANEPRELTKNYTAIVRIRLLFFQVNLASRFIIKREYLRENSLLIPLNLKHVNVSHMYTLYICTCVRRYSHLPQCRIIYGDSSDNGFRVRSVRARTRVYTRVYTFDALKYSRDQYSALDAIYDFSIASRDFSREFRQLDQTRTKCESLHT